MMRKLRSNLTVIIGSQPYKLPFQRNPHKPEIVTRKYRCSDEPAYRVASKKRGIVAMHRKNSEDPDDTRHADAKQRNQSRSERIAITAQTS